jgi:hypothetical protein
MRGVVNERTTIIGSIRQTCKPSPRTHGRYPKRITHLRRALPSGIPGHSEGNTKALCGGEEMKKFIGLSAIILLSPLLLTLILLCMIGELSLKLYDSIYFPIYRFSGKPFDTQK